MSEGFTPEAIQARLNAAGDQMGAAVRDAMIAGVAAALADMLTERVGPGPWTLHPDGRVEAQQGG